MTKIACSLVACVVVACGGGGGGSGSVSYAASSPAHGATNVSISTTPTIDFAFTVDPLSVTTQTVELLAAVGTARIQVAGTPSASGVRITFTPQAPLARSTTYELRVKASVRSTAGASLGGAVSFSFTTEEATSGRVDLTYGTNGYARGPQAYVYGGVLQGDDKLVLVGSHVSTPVARQAASVVRLTATGAADTAFGNQGRVVTFMNSGLTVAYAVALDTSGRIVIAGESGGQTMVARYLSDGTLDTAFDTDGWATFDLVSLQSESATGVGLQSDGKIVICGGKNDFTGSGFVARLTSAGALDTTFGTSGLSSVAFGAQGSATCLPFALKVQSDDKVIVAGRGSNDLGVGRFNADGTTDTGFGTSGSLLTNLATSARGIALQTDGKILLVGKGTGPRLLRLTTAGALDGTFGTGGVAEEPVQGTATAVSGMGYAVAVQSDGKIVYGGTQDAQTATIDSHFNVIRVTSSGNRDTDFGASGVVRAKTATSNLEVLRFVGLASSGRIIAGGQTNAAAIESLAVRIEP